MDAVERGRVIAERRKAADLTQRKVAAHFGITASAVSEWERGLVTPEWHRIRELDRLLAADGKIAELFDMTAATPPSVVGGLGFDAVVAEVREAIAGIHARLDRLEQRVPSPPVGGRVGRSRRPVR